MPPKLNHTKSRAGCRRCKVRRVKCDEAHPVCNNCSRHGVPCEYGVSSKSTPQARSSVPRNGDDESEWDPDQMRLLELQLLHNFTQVVTRTFPSSDNEVTQSMWNNYAVGMAFKHPFLLNAMLALSAWYFVCRMREPAATFKSDPFNPTLPLEPEALDFMGAISPIKAQRLYLSLALKQHREALDNINQSAANGLLLSTILLSYQALGVAGDCDSDAPYSPPTRWLRLVRGIAEVSRAVEAFTQDATLVEFFTRMGGAPDFLDHKTIFNPENTRPFRQLLDFTRFPEPDFGTDAMPIYEQTLAYIGGIYRGLQDGESTRATFKRVLCMGLMVPEQFIDFIDQRRPRALVILACYCSMIIALDDAWMFRGMARREVNGVQTMLPDEWQWSLAWPQSMVLWKVGLPLPVPAEPHVL